MGRIIAALEKHPHIFDFTKDGLGEDVVYVVAVEILDQMGEEIDPDGAPWALLSASYEEWKSRVAPGEPMAVLYRHMRTLDQIQGIYRITPTAIEQVYGIDEEARQLATWFQEGGPDRPARRFYAFNQMAFARLRELFDARFATLK